MLRAATAAWQSSSGKSQPGIVKLIWPRRQIPDASFLLVVGCSHIICRGRWSRVPHFYFLAKRKAMTQGAIVLQKRIVHWPPSVFARSLRPPTKNSSVELLFVV